MLACGLPFLNRNAGLRCSQGCKPRGQVPRRQDQETTVPGQNRRTDPTQFYLSPGRSPPWLPYRLR